MPNSPRMASAEMCIRDRDTYAAKREWNGILMEGLTAEEQAEAEQLMARISQNARSHMREGKDQ